MGKKLFQIATLAACVASNACAFGGGRIESMDSLNKIKPGVTTAQQVREMFGPPERGPMSFPKLGFDSVEYDLKDFGDYYIISISYGSDGVVRDVMRLRRGGGI